MHSGRSRPRRSNSSREWSNNPANLQLSVVLCKPLDLSVASRTEQKTNFLQLHDCVTVVCPSILDANGNRKAGGCACNFPIFNLFSRFALLSWPELFW